MPYASDPNLDDQNNPNGQGNTQLAGSGAVAGGSSNTVAGGGNAPGSPAPTRPGGNFQDLNSYLDANSGNGFGQQFVGNVNNDVNAAGDAQTQAATSFKGASDAGTVKSNPDLVNQAVSDPYGFSQDPNNVSAFQAQTNAKYSGPQTFQDDQAAYQQASGATQKAENTAQAAQSEGGRFALLNNYFGTPNYNQGQQSLDNLLIQADPTTSAGIQTARQNADQAQVAFQNQAAPLQQYAAQNNATTQATAAAAQSAGNTALTGAQNTNQGALTAAQAAYQKAQADLAGASTPQQYQAILGAQVNQGTPNDPYNLAYTQGFQPGGGVSAGPLLGNTGPADAFGTGASAQGGSNNFWGVSPGSYVSQQAAPDASNVLTLQQQQQLNALQGLMGQSTTQYDASQAGKFDPNNPYAFNQSAFNQAEQTAQGLYSQGQAGIENNIMQAIQHPTNTRTSSEGPGILNVIQGQYDQLNALRAKYGLGPVANPYHENLGGVQLG